MKTGQIERGLELLRTSLHHLQIIGSHRETDLLIKQIEDYFSETDDCGCEGSCVRHFGDVKTRYISSDDGRFDMHPFQYCDMAAKIDEENGYRVDE